MVHRLFAVNLMAKITNECVPKRTMLLFVLQQIRVSDAR